MSIARRVLSIHNGNADSAAKWLDMPHKDLGWLSPNAAIAAGQFGRVEALVTRMEADKAKFCGRRSITDRVEKERPYDESTEEGVGSTRLGLTETTTYHGDRQ